MSVEAIQCPKCGGPLTVEEGRDSVSCTHCGAGLKITTGSSGHPLATLADIKDDTSLLAIRATLERLDERLSQARDSLDEIDRERELVRAEAPLFPRRVTMALWVMGGLIGAGVLYLVVLSRGTGPLQAAVQYLVIFLIAAFFAGLTMHYFVWRDEPAETEVHWSRIRKLNSGIQSTEREIEDLERRREELQSRLDALTQNL